LAEIPIVDLAAWPWPAVEIIVELVLGSFPSEHRAFWLLHLLSTAQGPRSAVPCVKHSEDWECWPYRHWEFQQYRLLMVQLVQTRKQAVAAAVDLPFLAYHRCTGQEALGQLGGQELQPFPLAAASTFPGRVAVRSPAVSGDVRFVPVAFANVSDQPPPEKRLPDEKGAPSDSV
jgi:hypothetical protein